MPSTSQNQWTTTVYKTGILYVACIFIMLGGFTSLFIYYNLDRTISSWFYLGAQDQWALNNQQPWKWFYDFGHIPGLVVMLVLTILWGVSFFNASLKPWRRYILLILLTFFVGAGILVNAVLKDHWGRPRPRQIQEFNGKWEYHESIQPGIPGKGKSFTCGHCTMGYIYISFIFFYRKSKIIAISGTILGIIYGILMSIARIGQGGHFATDTFWSLGIILLTSGILYYFLLRIPIVEEIPPSSSPSFNRAKGFILLSLALGGAFFFLTQRPFYKEYRKGLPLTPAIKKLDVQTNLSSSVMTIEYVDKEEGEIFVIVNGRGWPEISNKVKIQRTAKGDTLHVEYQILPHGYYSERHLEAKLVIARRFDGFINLQHLP